MKKQPNEKVSREQWVEELASRQRNVVFPDTVRNEAAGWRRLMESGKPLTFVQIVGIGLMFAAIGWAMWDTVKDKLQVSKGSGSLPERLWGGFADWIVLSFLCVAVFLILRWSVRRALRGVSSGRRSHLK